MKQQNLLSPPTGLIYAAGMMGWSMMINLISVILVYLYLPPANSGLPLLIMQGTVFWIFNVIALVTAGGRFVDALYDPFIAQRSDNSKNKKGRRIPFMRRAVLPSAVFCFLIFFPLTRYESGINIVWLVLTLVGFYVSSTTYIIPYNALLPQMAQSAEAKVKLSTYQSLGYVIGIGLAANAFNVASGLQHLGIADKLHAMQLTILCLVIIAAIAMFITAWNIDEHSFSGPPEKSATLWQGLRQAVKNRNFLIFIIADFAYWVGMTIIISGLMYFVTVLLRLPENMGNKLMLTMVLVSLLFYPVVNTLSKRKGKKPLMVISFFLLSLVFLGVYFLGRVAVSPLMQIYGLVIFVGLPLAALNILPNAVLADIIHDDTEKSGENKEALYFAVRYFFVKLAQTIGIGVFAVLLGFGKDVGHDKGIRANGLLGFCLCVIAAVAFSRFKEKRAV